MSARRVAKESVARGLPVPRRIPLSKMISMLPRICGACRRISKSVSNGVAVLQRLPSATAGSVQCEVKRLRIDLTTT